MVPASQRTFRQAPRVVERRVRDEHVLVPVGQGSPRLECVYVLNEVSSAIWAQAVQGRTVAAIVEHLTAEYDVEPQTAAEDTERILDELVRLGALTETA